MSFRVLLADDHHIVRDGLRALIEQQPDLEVVADAENGYKAVRLALEYRPDLVVMDISMPELNGIEATRQIMADLPNTKVLILSMHTDRQFVTEALRAGAAGFLLKDSAVEELVRAIRVVKGDRIYLDPEITGGIIEDYIRHSPSGDLSAAVVLTNRERGVLQLIAEGWTTRAIAEHLCVSVKTIETHRRQIMIKLDLHSVAELTKYAIREGLTSLDT
jgi:DNA-binding NarL/FixJ family response regulator